MPGQPACGWAQSRAWPESPVCKFTVLMREPNTCWQAIFPWLPSQRRCVCSCYGVTFSGLAGKYVQGASNPMNKPALLLALLSASCIATNAAEAPPFNWSGFVAAGKTVEVHGINGSIHTERASGGSVEVTALRTARHSDPNEVQIQVVPTDAGVKICAVYPNSSNDCEGKSRSHDSGRNNNDVEVAFTVRVPAGVNFEGHNVNGDIQIADIQGEAKAHTVNGNVTVAATESVEAHTVNGNVIATLGGTPRKAMGFHTVNGNIDLTMSGSAAAQVSAHTLNGSMSTDFPISVSGKIGGKTLAGEIGSGGPKIDMHTVNGSIRLHRGA
jgi:hypothetical protein